MTPPCVHFLEDLQREYPSTYVFILRLNIDVLHRRNFHCGSIGTTKTPHNGLESFVHSDDWVKVFVSSLVFSGGGEELRKRRDFRKLLQRQENHNWCWSSKITSTVLLGRQRYSGVAIVRQNIAVTLRGFEWPR